MSGLPAFLEPVYALYAAHPLAQSIGFCAFVIGLVAVAHKSDSRLRVILTVQSVVLGLHFYMLGAGTAALAAVITGARTAMSIFDWAKPLVPVFIAVYVIFAVLTYQGLVSLLPVTSGIIGTWAMFHLKGLRLRTVFLFTTTGWLAHNILVGSIGPSVMEGCMLGMHIYTIYRLRKDGERLFPERVITPDPQPQVEIIDRRLP